MGAFGGKVEPFKFQPHIKPTDNVIDFGSGGGFLLANLQCADRRGVEINPTARETAAANGIIAVADVTELPENWADVIISNHALEHTFQPLDEIKKLYTRLKPGGTIVFVTPYERSVAYKPNDVNQHIYTWSPMNLGNLFTLAGFELVESKEMRFKWPIYFQHFYRFLGHRLFHLVCYVWGNIFTGITQVKLIARKPL